VQRILIILILVGLWQTAPAQNKFKELVARIALLKVYLGYLQKGYSTVKDGLTLIGDIKQGEFKLHRNYFNSLKEVKIRSYSKIAEVFSLQIEVMQQHKNSILQAQACGLFGPGELEYIRNVYSSLLKEMAKDVELLIAVTTNGQLQMRDDQRLQQIEKLYRRVQEQGIFIRAFDNELKTHCLQRLKELKDIRDIRALTKRK